MIAHRLLHRLLQHPEGQSRADLGSVVGMSTDALEGLLVALQAEGVQLQMDGDRVWLVDARGAWGPHTLAWRTARPVHHHQSCPSTNRIARELARVTPHGAPLPVVVADHQSAGRGRRGRVWSASPGQNLLFSVVLRPALTPADMPRAILAWAAAMADVLDVSLKWPNDLVVSRGDGYRKLGGILAELETASSDEVPAIPTSVVLGVGINVSQTAFEDLPLATSLALLGRTVIDRAELLGALVQAIDAVDVQADDLLDLWRRRACMLGRTVRVGDLVGVAEGIRDDGALMVSGRPVLAGDVELISR